MRKFFVVMAAMVFVLGTVGAAHADTFGTLTHQALQNYWSNGGTTVTGCSGTMCGGQSDLTFGDATGIILWEMQEKVWYDEQTNLTTISYTVFNDNIDDTITAFAVFANTTALVNQSSGPFAWVGGADAPLVNGDYYWYCDPGQGACDTSLLFGGQGIGPGSSVNSMVVQFTGQVGIGFNYVLAEGWNLGIIEPDGTYNWLGTSVVPEPASLSLLGFGLLGLAGLRRKYFGR